MPAGLPAGFSDAFSAGLSTAGLVAVGRDAGDLAAAAEALGAEVLETAADLEVGARRGLLVGARRGLLWLEGGW